MKKNLTILEGPILSVSGYGEHSRLIARALMTRPDKFDLHLFPVKWGATSWQAEDTDERHQFDEMVKKTFELMEKEKGKISPDLHIHVGILNEHQRKGLHSISVTAGIETDKISPEWVEHGTIVDALIVPSNHAKHGFDKTVIEVRDAAGTVLGHKTFGKPVNVVPYPVRKFPIDEEFSKELDEAIKPGFNFLCFGQWGPRKNIEDVVRWFCDEFSDHEEIGLVLKTSHKNNSIPDKYSVKMHIEQLVRDFEGRKCKITLIHGDLTDSQIFTLYQHSKIKAMISLAHGECWGLPMFDAASVGLPIISVDWGGQLDFLYMPAEGGTRKAKFARVKYTLKPIQKEAIWPGVLHEGTMWAFPEMTSAKMAMRKMISNHEQYVREARSLQKWLHEEFTEEKIYAQIVDIFSKIVDTDIDEWLAKMEIQDH